MANERRGAHVQSTVIDTITETVSGRPARLAALVIEGEPGSGVTTLLAEAVRLGTAQQLRVLRGSVTDRRELGLLIDAFGGTTLADTLRAALDPGAGADPCRRAQLARHMVEWIGTTGVLLVLDDVQRADPESMAMLGLLMRHPDVRSLRVVLGARAGQLPAELRAACLGGDRFQAVRVPPWDVAAVRAELPQLSAVRARVLCDVAQGRPAFVMALSAMPTRELRQLERLPVTVVADRIAAATGVTWPCTDCLSAAARLVAGSAALLDRDVDVERVSAVCGLGADDVLPALAELVAANVLSEDAGRLRFVHPVVRAAAYRWVTAPERVALHRRAMAALTLDGASALDVADHLAIGARVGDHDAARALVAAARRRLAADPSSAERWATAAIRCVADPDDTDNVTLDEARFLLAQAHAETGRAKAAIEVAHDLLRDGPFRGRAAVLIARCERALGRHAIARSVLLGELPLAADNPGLSAEIALELLANAVFLPAESMSPGRDGLTVVDDVADDTIDAAARAVLALGSAVQHGEPARNYAAVLAQADEVGDLVDRLSNRGLAGLVEHLPVLVWCESRLDLTDRAISHADRALVAARGRDHAVARLLVVRAHVALLRGHLDLVLELASEAAEIGLELGMTDLARVAEAVALRARLWSGASLDPDGVVPAAVRLDAVGRFIALASADVLHQMGHHEAARGVILPLVASLSTPGSAHESPLPALTSIRTDDAVAVLTMALTIETASGNLGTARTLWSVMQQLAGSCSRRDTAALELAGAVLACAEGRVDEGCELAMSAARHFERLGAPLSAGRARLQAADAYRMTDDLDGAYREIGAAKRAFQLGNAEFLVGTAVTAQKRVAASQSRGLQSGSFGLSSREAEIAQLVCQGLTNRAIAQRLFLSVRTVDSHVARILAKVGVPSRISLVAMFPAQPAVAASS